MLNLHAGNSRWPTSTSHKELTNHTRNKAALHAPKSSPGVFQVMRHSIVAFATSHIRMRTQLRIRKYSVVRSSLVHALLGIGKRMSTLAEARWPTKRRTSQRRYEGIYAYIQPSNDEARWIHVASNRDPRDDCRKRADLPRIHCKIEDRVWPP